jgi:Multicopper oxidase
VQLCCHGITSVILIGPVIRGRVGQFVNITVINEGDEVTAIHWHGQMQTGTPFSDGPPGSNQCPINMKTEDFAGLLSNYSNVVSMNYIFELVVSILLLIIYVYLLNF